MRSRPLWRASVDHLRWPRLLLDVLLLGLAAVLTQLTMLFSSAYAFDAVLFQGWLDYDEVAAAGSGLTIAAGEGLAVVNRVPTADEPLIRAAEVTSWRFDPTAASGVDQLIRPLAGEVTANRVAVDQSIAHEFGLNVGDYVLVRTGEETTCTATVGAVIRSYAELADLRRGLLVLADDNCPAPTGEQVMQQLVFNPTDAAAARTWWEVQGETARAAVQPRISGALIPILLVSLSVWLFMVQRAGRGLREQWMPLDDVLHAIGVARWRTRLRELIVLLSLTTATALLGAALTPLLLWNLAEIYVQPWQARCSAVSMSVVAVLGWWLAARPPHRRRPSAAQSASSTKPSAGVRS